MKSDRLEFNETWVMESPEGIGKWASYDGLCYGIKDTISQGHSIIKLPNNLNKLEAGNLIYYWYGDANKILLGSELHVKPNGLVVAITGKEPDLVKQKQPPYASELYLAIINDTQKAIRLLSDKQLSDQGFNIWKRLYNDNILVGIYDSKNNVGQSFKRLGSYKEFKQYYKLHDADFQRYQYVLFKNGSNSLIETCSYFNLRRMRELAGLDVDWKE